MTRKAFNLSRRYQTALRTYLKAGPQADIDKANGLGAQALAAGLQTLDLAKLHEQTLITELLPACPPARRAALIRQAGIFFAAAVMPMEENHRSAREAAIQFKKFVETLSRRTVELAASNLELNLEIAKRKAVEDALKKSQRHYSELLEQSDRLQKQLRRLSHQILTTQENERKKISRELHDVIAQALSGINIRLATLKREAALNTAGLDRNIARTQRLVEKSVNIVHRFARELRPTVLDDLGLIPALHTFMKGFREQTGLQVSLSAFATIEQINGDKRTVLYRVAQEALTNVARHAHASRVRVEIRKLDRMVSMKIQDNGRGFQKDRVLHAKRGKRLGLLGMRERLEMVGGSFSITSAPHKGTTVMATIPIANRPVQPDEPAVPTPPV